MSDDSEFGNRNKRKRSICPLSVGTSSYVVTTSRRRGRRSCFPDDSDSDSGSSIDLQPKKKAVLRVASDSDSDSPGSPIIQRPKRATKMASDSESSDGSDSSGSLITRRNRRPAKVGTDSESDDHGFEESSNSQWESEGSEDETLNSPTKLQDTGVHSDSSDGQSEKCPICLVSFTTQEIGTPDTCEHLFCVECIQEWSKNVNTCPVDRKEYHNILVRQSADDGIYKKIAIQPPNPQVEPNIVEDLTFCEVCGSGDREDRMLLCDGCDLGYHLECLNPPLAEIPAGAWFCSDCTPDDLVDPEIELHELQLLLDDAHELGRPTGTRRTTASRLVPRTRQTERVRRRIANNRINQAATVSSTMTRRRPKRRRKRKPRYRLVYTVDEATGETIATRKRVKKRRTKKRRLKRLQVPATTKKRLASQLGMCAIRGGVPQNLPDVRIQPAPSSLQSQRLQAGIPTLRMFGGEDDVDYVWSEGEGEGVIARRGFPRRRTLMKSVEVANPVSSSSDILSTILDEQTMFHSRQTRFTIDKDGRFTMQRRDLSRYGDLVSRRPATYSNDAKSDDVPSSSGGRSRSNNSSVPTSTVENSEPADAAVDGDVRQFGNPEEYGHGLRTHGEAVFVENKKEKKQDDPEDNTPRSGTPASESEIDIYSDIETVSTSKADEAECKVPSPLSATPNGGSDDENDSEPDMVIDTDKPEENATVTSTVDSNIENVQSTQTVTSTSEIQSQAIQSSNQLFDDKSRFDDKNRDDDEDSEDGCPNFSIYSKESITMAKNTDISLASNENDQVGEVSSSPEQKNQQRETQNQKPSMGTVLYSDSEDESVVKRENSFGITDIRNMTEDISEEERSYTPCLDERPVHYKEGIEGLDTEMISDEDRNDFDESHDQKTASDGDALEINAKESELDFTRPEDYEEGEIVDKTKVKQKSEDTKKLKEEPTKKTTKKNEAEKPGNKENENRAQKQESAFKKLSKNTKERNYREKDRDRSKSREKKEKEKDRREKRKEKRKEIERYDVRALIAEKPRRMKDKFGRDLRLSASRSKTRTPSPQRRSLSRTSNRSTSKSRRRSLSKHRSVSRGRKKRRRSKNRRSASRSKSRSAERRRSRSKTKKRRRSPSRERRRKSRDKSKKHRSRSRQRSRSTTPKRTKEWRRHSREWTPSLSRSVSPEPRQLTPSWTPPRIMDNTVKPHNLTVILTNDSTKKKKEKKKKAEKKAKENDRAKKRKRDRTPPPSKEVFASGDNILVSVSFNKDNETRDVSTKKKREVEEAPPKKTKKDKVKKKKRNKDLAGVKPVAIIDLEKSPFKELTPSPKDVIVLSDSDNEEAGSVQKGACDSSQNGASLDRINNYTTGPKTPPEPQIKFTLASKQTQMRAISNPLHEPDDIETEENTQEVVDAGHKGPNTPPEPPNSPPSSPDAYDPFEPTKSRSPTPEIETAQSNIALNLDDNRDDSVDIRPDMDKSNNSSSQAPDITKSHTPPLADVQPADSQSSTQATPESSLGKSPEHVTNAASQTQATTTSKPVAQSIPFSASLPSSVITSTPTNTSLAPPRINILNTTIITPPHVASSIPQRIVLPNATKSSPLKISPAIKSTSSKSMPSKAARKSTGRNQNGSESVELNPSFDSPYSPGSSDYEDLFEPPVEAAKPTPKPTKNAKSPAKVQNAFDSLFGTSPFNKIKTKQDKPAASKFGSKKGHTVSGKGTKQVGVKLDEDNLKILDELPNSAVEMQVKDKFLKKLNRQERVVEEVKLVLKPHYNKKHINKEEYKDILRRAVPKICHNKSGEINPTKIKNLIEAYVKKVRHSKKVTSSSSTINPQKP